MSAITIADIEARVIQAFRRLHEPRVITDRPFGDMVIRECQMWRDVLERVRAGRDPILAVLERE